jgi:3D (Asp-Asp-Asp) domain-containing protein
MLPWPSDKATNIANTNVRFIIGKRLLILLIIVLATSSYAILILISSDFVMPQKPNINTEYPSCSGGWNVTGYFSPVESDYVNNGYNQTIVLYSIDNSEPAISRSFNSEFLKDVHIEGWGKTNENTYIGQWKGRFWGTSTFAQGDRGDPLIAGSSAATDRTQILYRSNFTIPTLPSPWNSKVFTAVDIGRDIVGKHIDIYTGVGATAQKETMKITGTQNIVCMAPTK